MRRYGAFQSVVNSFPTINCISPTTYHPCPALFLTLSPSRSLLSVHPLLAHPLAQPSSPFSLSSATHVLLAPRRTRHVLATYIVPPNNVCPKGREITDSVARRATNIAATAGRSSRQIAVLDPRKNYGERDILEKQARLFFVVA